MNSIWYGLAMVAIFVIVHWFITNDTLPEGQSKGLLAMKPPGEPPVASRARKRAKFSLKNARRP